MERWFNATLHFYRRFQAHEIPALGAQMSYYLILAFFPFLIFLLILLSFTPITGDLALADLSRLLPEASYKIIQEVVDQTLAAKRHTLLSFGLIFTLWSASSGVNAIIRGINKAYDEPETRPFWIITGISLLFTIGLAIVIILSLTLLVLGKFLGLMFFNYLGFSRFFLAGWGVLRFALPLVVMLMVFAFIYRVAPNRKISFIEVLPGAFFSTLGWVATSWVFSFYVNNFANYSRTYGSLGGIIVLLLWLYLSSIIILLGGELNAVLVKYKS